MSWAFPSPGYQATIPAGGAAHTAALIVVEVWLLVWGEAGSVVADAVAVFRAFPGEPAVTTIVNVSLPPGAMSAPVQLTVGLLYEQPADAETNVTPAGNVSLAVTPVALAAAAAEF